MLDSLVRVSRRAAYSHYASILADARTSVPAGRMPRAPISPPRGEVRWARIYPTAETDAGLPAEECPGRRARVSNYRQVWLQALPFQQFHVLFDSLSKVLFIFRSLYLCAIGLWPIFSLEEIYLPFRAAFPNNSTRRRGFTRRGLAATYGILTLCDVLFQGT